MTDLMADLETLGTKPGCVIVSIGAVRFDRDGDGWATDTAHEFYARVSIEDCLRCGLSASGSTIEWWMQRAAKWPPPTDALPLSVALLCFSKFIELGAPPRIWAHGATFDPPILVSAYDAVSLPVPWSYRQVRDTRTLFDEAGLDYRTEAHHALDDARAQARAVQAARRKLQGRAA